MATSTPNRRAFLAGLGAGLVIIKSSRSRAADPVLDPIIGRLIMINLWTAAPGPDFLEQLSRHAVGGVYLDSAVFSSAANARAAVSALRDAAAAPLVITTDCEGKPVNRCAKIRALPSARSLGRDHAAGKLDDRSFEQTIADKAAFLQDLGLNANFDPVLDLAVPGSPIGERSYGRDPAAVSALARLIAAGYRRSAVACTAKHFPGLGAARVDSHLALPSLATPLDELRRTSLAPFAAAISAGIPAVMVAHLKLKAIDPDRPASLSPKVIGDLLRKELGFRGVVIPDSLTMDAVTKFFGKTNRHDPRLLAERCVAAFAAGADLIFNFHTPPASTGAIVAAVREAVKSRRLSPASLEAAHARVALLAAP